MPRSLKRILNSPFNGKQLYFLAFILFFLPTFLLDATFAELIGEHWLRILSYLALPLLFFKIYVFDRWKPYQLLLISLFIFLGIITWRTAQNIELLMIVPFVVGAKNVDFHEIMSWYFYLGMMLLILMAVFSLINIIPNLVYRYGTRPARYSLGMIFPSTIAAHFLFLALSYCYLRFGYLKWFDYCFVLLGGLIGMFLTNTRIDFLATLMIIPIMIIAQRAFENQKWSRLFASFWWMAVPLLSATTIVCSFFYNPKNHIMSHIDSLTSGRLSLGRKAFQKFDIRLFGRTIVEHSYVGIKGHKLANSVNAVSSKYFYIDSSYIRMILLWGFLAFLMIVTVITLISLRSTIHKTYILSAIFLVASLNYMFEPHIIQIVYSPFLLAFLSDQSFSNSKEDIVNAKQDN